MLHTAPARTLTRADFPMLAPRQPAESAHEYGARCLLFATRHGAGWVDDDEALRLADHVFPSCLSPEISPTALARLQAVRDDVTATLRRRAALMAREGVQTAHGATNEDRPNLGPMAPLTTPPVAPVAPPAVELPPAPPVAAPAPKAAQPVLVSGPAAIPARHTAVSPALAARAAAPAVPKVSAEDWGF